MFDLLKLIQGGPAVTTPEGTEIIKELKGALAHCQADPKDIPQFVRLIVDSMKSWDQSYSIKEFTETERADNAKLCEPMLLESLGGDTKARELYELNRGIFLENLPRWIVDHMRDLAARRVGNFDVMRYADLSRDERKAARFEHNAKEFLTMVGLGLIPTLRIGEELLNECDNVVPLLIDYKLPLDQIGTTKNWGDFRGAFSDINPLSPTPAGDIARSILRDTLHLAFISMVIDDISDSLQLSIPEEIKLHIALSSKAENPWGVLENHIIKNAIAVAEFCQERPDISRERKENFFRVHKKSKDIEAALEKAFLAVPEVVAYKIDQSKVTQVAEPLDAYRISFIEGLSSVLRGEYPDRDDLNKLAKTFYKLHAKRGISYSRIVEALSCSNDPNGVVEQLYQESVDRIRPIKETSFLPAVRPDTKPIAPEVDAVTIVRTQDFRDWFKELPESEKKSVEARIFRAENGNWGDWKPTQERDVFEMRLHSSGLRLYFWAQSKETLVLLSGGGKDSKASQSSDIKKAREILGDFKASPT